MNVLANFDYQRCREWLLYAAGIDERNDCEDPCILWWSNNVIGTTGSLLHSNWLHIQSILCMAAETLKDEAVQ